MRDEFQKKILSAEWFPFTKPQWFFISFWKNNQTLKYIHTTIIDCSYILCFISYNNRLLTEREGRTGEYWPEVVAVRTERGPVLPRPRANIPQYGSSNPGLIASCLLYGTLFLIVKCTSGGLHLKGFRRDVFVMTRATQTKATYHEFEKQIYWIWNRLKLA